MKKQAAAWILSLASLVFVSTAGAQGGTQPQQTPAQADRPSGADNQNIQAYIELLRSNVRQQKAEMMGAVMQLGAADASKIWPIYEDYDAELNKVNALRVGEYSRVCAYLMGK